LESPPIGEVCAGGRGPLQPAEALDGFDPKRDVGYWRSLRDRVQETLSIDASKNSGYETSFDAPAYLLVHSCAAEAKAMTFGLPRSEARERWIE
jgi:hypothetical protein